LEKAIEGVDFLKKDEVVQNVGEEMKQLFDEYQEAQKRGRKEIEKSAQEILHQMRISGRAVGEINPRALPEWQERLNKVCQPYQERLAELKKLLCST
jgi:hypothetical protein